MERIAIIGLGLIGGSIGLALKRSSIKELHVVGTARTRDTLQRAKKLGAIDEEARTAGEAVRDARLVIIAAPILATRPLFEEIAPALLPGAIVTDVGSTKANVMRWAKELLPATAHFVGGHPMAGKETSGIDAADADLFREKTWVVVPSVTAGGAHRRRTGAALRRERHVHGRGRARLVRGGDQPPAAGAVVGAVLRRLRQRRLARAGGARVERLSRRNAARVRLARDGA